VQSRLAVDNMGGRDDRGFINVEIDPKAAQRIGPLLAKGYTVSIPGGLFCRE